VSYEHMGMLQGAVASLHGCGCAHSGTTRVVGFHGDGVFVGGVETFTLSGHPEASEVFARVAWDGEEQRCIAVLRRPPVLTPSDAVRAANSP
jgi:hypothetical protein